MFFGSVTETVGVFWLDCTLLLGPVKFLISKLVSASKNHLEIKKNISGNPRKGTQQFGFSYQVMTLASQKRAQCATTDKIKR